MTAPARIAATAPARPVRLDWLSVADLRVDPAYQRQLGKRSEKLVREIAAGWDWARVGALIVGPAADGDGWAVIDGQHRMLAASAAGIAELPCVVTGEAATPDQARAFVGVNEARQRMTPGHRHVAAVAAGDPDAIALQEVLDAAGVIVEPREGWVLGPRQTRAVGRLRKLMRVHGGGVLEDALRLLVEAQPDQPGILLSSVIEGLCLVVARLRGLEMGEDRLAEVLAEIEIETLAKSATSAAALLNRRVAPVVASEITRRLNHGRRQRIAEEY